MQGRIDSGQLVTVEPFNPEHISKNDIVFCRVGRAQYLHLIRAIKGSKYQICNNIGRINGWVNADSIFGKCIKVED